MFSALLPWSSQCPEKGIQLPVANQRAGILRSIARNKKPLLLSFLLVAQTVKRLLAVLETWVRFLGREDPLEKEMAIHSSTLAWKIPWTEELDRLQSMGSQRGHE